MLTASQYASDALAYHDLNGDSDVKLICLIRRSVGPAALTP